MTTIYTVNNKVLKNSANDKWLTKYVDPYNPLGLPPFTIRVKLIDGGTSYLTGAVVTAVQGQSDVYDVYKNSTDWHNLFYYQSMGSDLVEILGMNSTGVTNIENIFEECSRLTAFPLFDTSTITNMNGAFANCVNVESGALALYQQASTQATPPTNHSGTFFNCGKNTVTGAAELAQIPSDWKS